MLDVFSYHNINLSYVFTEEQKNNIFDQLEQLGDETVDADEQHQIDKIIAKFAIACDRIAEVRRIHR